MKALGSCPQLAQPAPQALSLGQGPVGVYWTNNARNAALPGSFDICNGASLIPVSLGFCYGFCPAYHLSDLFSTPGKLVIGVAMKNLATSTKRRRAAQLADRVVCT
jgi:hypothetical protein